MIKKVKRKFIALTMAFLFVLLLILVTGMNLINYHSVVSDSDEILSLLSHNKGMFPEFVDFGDGRFFPNMSAELPYESRYFSILITDSGLIIHVDTSRIASVDTDMAVQYASTALYGNSSSGFIDNYRYALYQEGPCTRITFLDCGRRLDSFYNFLYTSIAIAIAGFVVMFIIVFFLAGKIIRPIAESYEKQKQFITDAGHEIKTPLTIIRANVDVLEMDLGKNEYLADIQQQTTRLTSLTNNLVQLARMEEAENTIQMVPFPISEVISDTAAPFRTLAETQDKNLHLEIQPMLTMNGNSTAIEQLISILMDNALKYSPVGGNISLTFTKQMKSLVLTLQNTTDATITPENLNHIFDRFYRADPSRNSQTGGHGIGLSLAKAIVSSHGGKIHAAMQAEDIFQITVTLPA